MESRVNLSQLTADPRHRNDVTPVLDFESRMRIRLDDATRQTSFENSVTGSHGNFQYLPASAPSTQIVGYEAAPETVE